MPKLLAVETRIPLEPLEGAQTAAPVVATTALGQRAWPIDTALGFVRKPGPRMSARKPSRITDDREHGPSWLSTHNDLPFGAGALSGGLVPAARLVNALSTVNLPARSPKCRREAVVAIVAGPM